MTIKQLNYRRLCGSAALSAGLAISGGAFAEEEKADLPQSYNDLTTPADVKPMVACSLLLDIDRIGNELIAVGERGHVIKTSIDNLSKDFAFDHKKICHRESDEFRIWEQQTTPTRTYLLSASFISPTEGWVVGHDQAVLHTTDGGATWEWQHKDGPSQSVFLDVMFLDANTGFATAPLGMLWKTTDGGQSWEQSEIYIDPEYDEPDDYNLNAIKQLGDDTLFVAGEGGVLYRSSDLGATWEKLENDYEGSYFGIEPVGREGVLIYGLRGNAFLSRDRGDNWTALDTGSTATLLASAPLPNGEIAVAGAKGALLISQGGHSRLKLAPVTKVGSDGETAKMEDAITDILALNDGRLILATEKGVRQYTPK